MPYAGPKINTDQINFLASSRFQSFTHQAEQSKVGVNDGQWGTV